MRHNEIEIPASCFPDPSSCLGRTPFLDVEHPSIQECAAERAPAHLSSVERAIRLFDFVRDEIAYEFLAKLRREEYEASYVLRMGRGFCTQKAVLLATLGRAAGIPSVLILTDLRDESLTERASRAMEGRNLFEYHGIVGFHVDGRWMKVDATFSPDIVERKRHWRVDFDGSGDALLAGETREGKPHIRYEGVKGVYVDLPFDEMTKLFREQALSMDMEAYAAAKHTL